MVWHKHKLPSPCVLKRFRRWPSLFLGEGESCQKCVNSFMKYQNWFLKDMGYKWQTWFSSPFSLNFKTFFLDLQWFIWYCTFQLWLKYIITFYRCNSMSQLLSKKFLRTKAIHSIFDKMYHSYLFYFCII